MQVNNKALFSLYTPTLRCRSLQVSQVIQFICQLHQLGLGDRQSCYSYKD